MPSRCRTDALVGPPLEDLGHLRQPGVKASITRAGSVEVTRIEVAHGLLAAAQGAGGHALDPADAGGAHARSPRPGAGAPQRHPCLPSPHQCDALEEVLLGLRLDAGQPAKLARPRQRLELAEVGDLQAVVEDLGGLGPNPGDAHEIREPGGHLAPQRFERLHPARPEVLADLAGQIRSDPRYLVEPPVGSGSQRPR
jgi:hypothetical protein